MDRVVSEIDLKECAKIDLEALACVRGCLTRFVQGRVGAARFMALPLATGGADVALSGAHVDGLYSAAMRIEGRSGRKRDSALLLVDPESGSLQAILRDNAYLARLGRALTGAAGVSSFTPDVPLRVVVYGASEDILEHLLALQLVRSIDTLFVNPADTSQTDSLLKRLQAEGLSPQLTSEPVAEAHLVYALGAAPPSEWLPEEACVVSLPDEPWYPEALGRVSRGFADDPSRSLLRVDTALGEVTGGRVPATIDHSGITLIELTDHPMVDTALGFLAWRKSQKYKLGVVLEA